MKKIFHFLLFYIILSFISIINVYAECSYQERKDLLNAAKKVDVSFEVVEKEEEYVGRNPNTDVEETFIKTVYNFKMNVVGITDNIFLKVTNDFNEDEVIVTSEKLNDNVYSYEIDNTTDIIKYYLSYYSLNENCFASEIITKTIKKPKENTLYYMPICLNEKVRDNKYCKHFIDEDFSISETLIVEKLKSVIEDDNNNDNKHNISHVERIRNIIFSYWYIILIVFVVMISAIILIFIRRKRSRL